MNSVGHLNDFRALEPFFRIVEEAGHIFDSCSPASVGARSARDTVHPARQALIRCSSETAPAVTVKSRFLSAPDGTTIERSLKRRD
jgi:hypothetical protein